MYVGRVAQITPIEWGRGGVGVLKIVIVLRQHCVREGVSTWQTEKGSVVREDCTTEGSREGCWNDTLTSLLACDVVERVELSSQAPHFTQCVRRKALRRVT